jgi:hypothetical protein
MDAEAFRQMRGFEGSVRIILAMIYTAPFRLIAIVLLVALAVMVATPEKADALEPLTIIVIVLIAFLVIANKEGPKRADNGPIYVACNGSDCLALATQAAASYGTVSSVHVVSVVETQGP